MTDNKKLRIISSNLSVLRRRTKANAEQTDIVLRLLADEVGENARREGLENTYRDFCLSADIPTLEQRALFCRYMTSDTRFAALVEAAALFGNGEGAVPGTHGKVAYVRNPKVAAAYSQFAKTRRGIKAYHVSTFAQGCEAVAGNLAEFCILPMENSRDGKLYTFYSMLDKYELKICGAAEAEDEDGVGRTTFALASRRLELTSLKSAVRRFEFSVIGEDADIICDIIQAGRVLGGTLCAVGTQPLDYDEIRKKYYFAFDFKAASPLPLALFLSLEYQRYEAVGLYAKGR